MNADVVIVGAGPAGIFTALEMIKKGSRQKIVMVEKGQPVEKRHCPKDKTKKCVNCKPYCHITTGFSGAGAFSDGKLSLSYEVGGDLPTLIGADLAQETIDYADQIYLEFGADEHIEGLGHEEERKEIRRRAIQAGLKLVDCPIRHMGTEKAQGIYLAIERYLQENGVEMYFGYECSNLILENEVCKGVAISDGKTDLEIYANYGFDSKAVESDDRLKAWQGAFVLSHTNDSGVNKVILRYSDNSDNSVYNKTDDLTTVYASFEGSHKFTRQAQVEYLLAFHDYDNSADKSDNRKNYGAIVRPMYFWNDVHSTWLEAGYQRVDYDNGGDNSGWKLTLSQNIAIGMGPEFRPMLRFYVTGGQVDNEHTAKVNGTQDQQLDSLNVGGMFEAWF